MKSPEPGLLEKDCFKVKGGDNKKFICTQLVDVGGDFWSSDCVV